MIKFFRHIRRSLINQNKMGKYYKYAAGEIVLVVIGILIALQLNSWKEKRVEQKVVKQYISSLKEDLKTDTTLISTVQGIQERIDLGIDSLIAMLKSQKIKGNENDLYFFGRHLLRAFAFRSNDRTIAQLKNSGSMRLIENESVANSIMAYYSLVEAIYRNQEDHSTERSKSLPVIYQIYNPYVFDDMVTPKGINRPTNNPPLRNYDPSLQQDFAHLIHQIKGSNFLIKTKLSRLNKRAVDLINLIEQEYDLE